MIQELQTERLDINNHYNVDIICKQLDDVMLKIIVYDKSVPADLGNYTCRLKAFKADQVPLIQNTNIVIKDNIVTIKADKQLTTTTGIVKAELQFINKTTLEKKSTFYINIEVIASVLDVDGIVSTPTCTILEEIDHKLDEIENIGEVLDEAKEVRDTLTNKTIPTATSINSKLETNIGNASTKITEVESIISSASIKIEEVETCINNADFSKKELDLSKTNADMSKENLDTANTLAEKNIEELNKLGDVTDLAKNVQTNITDIGTLKTDVDNNTSQLKDCAKNIKDIDGSNAYIFDANNCGTVGKRTTHRTNSNTLNTPYKQGLTSGYVEGIVDTYLNSANFGIQIGYATGHELLKRSLISGTWTKWKQLATTEEIDLTNYLRNGWEIRNCSFRGKKIGNEMFIEGILFNNLDSPSKILAQGLPTPSDGKWHGGNATSSENNSIYVVIEPNGDLMFQQGGQKKDMLHSINIHYPIG
ncbi:viral A-type inclusion protein [Clostridium sp. ZBS20]|uniref:viral A-type inclusion protein n=1 Tax=Clostridium sp. ZBS20 TaxID=2949966 RepID=UPI00207A4EE0|nr:viral A-type inclusion protein [Clostridium sp. ZBS20]